jgi:hypothetical protein
MPVTETSRPWAGLAAVGGLVLELGLVTGERGLAGVGGANGNMIGLLEWVKAAGLWLVPENYPETAGDPSGVGEIS